MSDMSMTYVVIALVCFFAAGASAEVTLPTVFSDGMVLQREMKVPVWGDAGPDSEVTVRFDDQSATTRADEDGEWRVELDAMEASSQPRDLVVETAEDKRTFTDVLVGEVWFCSGQSNMAMSVEGTKTAEKSIEQADIPELRFFQPRPGNKKTHKWVKSSPDTAPGISAVSFYYGRALHSELDIPVGMVICAKGGTMIQSWISRKAIKQHPQFNKEILEAYETTATEKKLSRLMGEDWDEKVEEADGEVQEATDAVMGVGSCGPGHNFERYKVGEIAPYAIRGFVWYQGESNAWGIPIALRYQDELELLINDWRQRWDGEDRPFMVVQLPHYPQEERADKPSPINPWSVVIEQQWQIQDVLPNVYTAVTIDLGKVGDIHPDNKAPIGERLDLLARKYVYDQDIVARGPVFDSMTVEDGRAILSFEHVGGGLEAREVPPTPAGDDELEGFLIAGKDRHFVRAKTEIEDGRVICWSDEIDRPAAVRYAMHGNCLFNLYNKKGLPAGPFRTDDWPMDTPQKKQRIATAVRAESAPTIDGQLNDTVWEKTVPQNSLELFHTYHDAQHQTLARFAWDSEALYVAFECLQPMDSVRSEAKKRDDETIWSDDNVQLLLDTNHDRQTYVRFAVNPDGVVADGEGFNDWRAEGRLYHQGLLPYYRDIDYTPDMNSEVATRRLDDRWTVEMAIPWKSLGLESSPNGKMGLQFTRTYAATDERSEWATTGIDYNTGAMIPVDWAKGQRLHHGVGRFGTLKFDNK